MEHAIRDATADDAAACAAIYAPYIADTAITFETEPAGAEDFTRRIADSQREHAWLVGERDGRVAGYAYGGQYKVRAAYRWACEVSVYLEMGLRRSGLGRELYQELFNRLADRGYTVAIAGMTLPNPASEGLHQAMGFEPAGVYRNIGWKHGSWHDVAWVQRDLAPRTGEPAPVR